MIRIHWLTTRHQLCSDGMASWRTVTNLLRFDMADLMSYNGRRYSVLVSFSIILQYYTFINSHQQLELLESLIQLSDV